MSTQELLERARYVVDSHGTKTAVVIDIQVWEQLLHELGFEGDASRRPAAKQIRLPGIRIAEDSQRPQIDVEVTD
jgi:hypothetical protein